MSDKPQTTIGQRRYGLLIGSLATLIIIGAIYTQSLEAQSGMQPLPLPEATDVIEYDAATYSPEYYGLPNEIAGYEVIAVKSAENTPCVPEDLIEVWLAVPNLDSDSLIYEGDDGVHAELLSELRSIYETHEIVEFAFVKHEVTTEQFIQDHEAYNAARNQRGCVPRGGQTTFD